MFGKCNECGGELKKKKNFFTGKTIYTCEKCKTMKVYDKYGLKEEYKDGKLVTERKHP